MGFALELGGRQTVFHIGTSKSTGVDSVGLHKRTAEGSQGEELMEVARCCTRSQRGWLPWPLPVIPEIFPNGNLTPTLLFEFKNTGFSKKIISQHEYWTLRIRDWKRIWKIF